jgi:hypothetical protein
MTLSVNLLEIIAIIIVTSVVYYYLSKRSALVELYFTLVLLLLFVVGSLLEVYNLLVYSNFSSLPAYVLLVGGVPYLLIYAIKYYKLLLVPEILSFILVSIILVSLFGGAIINQSITSLDVNQVINPRVDTTSLFYDYINLLANSSYNFQVNLPSSLQNESNEVKFLILNFSSCLRNISNVTKSYYKYLEAGNVKESLELYNKDLVILEKVSTYYNEIQYLSKQLAPYSLNRVYQEFLVDLQNNYTTAFNLLSGVSIVTSIIESLPNTSHLPVSISIVNKQLLLNTTNLIEGYISGKNESQINGTVLVRFLNYTLKLPVIHGSFSFNYTLNKYLLNITFTVTYSGNSLYLPNISTFLIHTNVQRSILIVKILNTSKIVPGGYLIIKGHVTGVNRELLVSLLNESKLYTVSGNFTITFPLPYNLTNITYTLNLTLLSKGLLSPSSAKLSFTPKLYHTILKIYAPSRWIIPSLLIVSGRLTSYNGSGISDVKVFVFVGTQRYEAVTDTQGYFSVAVKPKITVLFGKQVIYVESDPHYYYYREISSTYTEIYNPLVIVLPLVIGLSIYVLRRVRKNRSKRKPKGSRLIELKVR